MELRGGFPFMGGVLALCLLCGGAAAETLPAPPPFDFAQYTQAGFLADRDALAAGVAAAEPGPSRAIARLDLAEFYLAHVMLPEGRSLLGDEMPDGLIPAEQARWRAIAAGFSIMEGTGVPTGTLLPNADWANWQDYHLWAALNAITQGDAVELEGNLAGAADRLPTYPPVFVEACLPALLEGAIAVRKWPLAQRLSRDFDNYPELKSQPVYSFLIGRVAEQSHHPDKAYAAYREAAKGQDRYAQRARLALVSLGLEHGALTPDQGLSMLAEANLAWRGDRFDLQALEQRAHLGETSGHDVDALIAYGEILTRFPERPQARAAAQAADNLLKAFYAKGAAGKISLTDFAEGHQRLETYYEVRPDFQTYAEQFADRLLELGATTQAATEYRKIREALSAQRKDNPEAVSQDRMAYLALREAEALARGGQFARAAKVLEASERPADAQELNQFNALQARVLAEAGKTDAALQAKVTSHSVDHLRLQARLHWKKGDWKAATQSYRELWKKAPDDFSETDAVELLLAAYRSGDLTTARSVAEVFPRLAGREDLNKLVASLLAEPAKLSPLMDAAARDRLRKADDALEMVGSEAKQAGG
ncbi:hypothetical protein [Thioclava sp. DLFJ4-1]|uniref:tetratricopeptide repeat protein n=1 Tax=Thioclava sp. DLFJ4-1 TaxID=1915313 RepID=UPI000998CDB2|nr:hypothetical protein [Thioclava sp. DLFJ4-1]OOY15253.1 hypothetical protein BMI85_17100 [Thioclava sp. DLFJ4-1]